MAWRTARPFGSELGHAHPRLDQGQATPLTPSTTPTARRIRDGSPRWFGALCALVLLAACGGSNSSSPGILPDNAPAQQQTAETPKAAEPSITQAPVAPATAPAPARTQAPVP